MEVQIALLETVISTMDTIPVVGVDNQDKFVGCAMAIRNVIQQLREAQTAQKKDKEATTDG